MKINRGRLLAPIVLGVFGLVRFVQSHFWAALAHENALAMEDAAWIFLMAWVTATFNYSAMALTSWKEKKAQRQQEKDQSDS